jgi:hypothetical protein
LNWEAIAAVSELVGAVGVIASVVYLALQVRRAISESRASTFHKIFEGLANHTNHMFGAENVDLVARGFRSYRDLSAADRMRFDLLMANLVNYFEASYYASEADTLGDETIENWVWWFESKIFCHPGVVEWWSDGQGIFPPAIRSWIDKRISNADQAADPYRVLMSES